VDIQLEKFKKWLEFDFPTDCQVDEWEKGFLKKLASGFPGGACCPFGFCSSAKIGAPCDPKTANECAKRCEEFYKKYIKGGEK
jgi:hypothetical protein